MTEKSQAELIVELALQGGVLLFRDQYNEPYIRYPVNDVPVTYPLSSGLVRDWLSKLLWDKYEKAPGGEAVNSALAVLRALAREGPQFELYNRVAPDGLDGIYIDVADDGWTRIHVTPEGWDLEQLGPVMFRRYSHQKPLPFPKRNGNPWDILRFANLRDDNHRLLYVIAIISNFIPGIQHPALIFHGPHGSGKTVAMKAARAVVDPSVVDLLTIPRNGKDIAQQLNHNYCAYYDNVTNIDPWLSDSLCRAITGAGITKRKLYTDDEDVIYEYRRIVALNGINIAATQGDLLDRSILLFCDMLENSQRMEERQLQMLLEDLAPVILGGILDTLVKALQIYPTIKLDKLYRMSDFTRYGCAVAESLNIDPVIFLQAYEENVRSQSEETLKASVPATVLMSFMDLLPEGVWRGSPEVLYDKLSEYAEELKISTRQKAWPKSANWFMRRLNEVMPSLLAQGYRVERDRSSKTRAVTIRKISCNTVNSVTTVTGQGKLENYEDNDDASKRT